MGCIDTKTKEYMNRPVVFADLFNHLMYNGESVIKPEMLSEMDTGEIAIPYDNAGKSYPAQKLRDVLKNTVIMEDSMTAYVLILGVENQTDVHYAMPVKNLLYDALNYASQVSSIARGHKKNHDKVSGAEYLSGMTRNDRLIPVVTLVVHFGQEPWDGPMSLHEMFTTMSSGIMQFVPDYRINLISPVSMTDEEIEKFKTDFRELAKIIKCGHDKDALQSLMENDDRFKHMDPLTADIANDVTNAGLKLTENEKGEVNMCAAIAGIREDGRVEGRAEGIAQGRTEGRAAGEKATFALIQKLFSTGRSAEIKIASENEEYRQKLMKEFGLI